MLALYIRVLNYPPRKEKEMRELKFRAWDIRTKKMSPAFVLFGEFTLLGAVHAWQHEESFALGIDDKFDSLGRLNDLEIMQYTGLKDKKENEIFEGDIIQCYESDGKTKITHIVLYEDSEARFIVKHILSNLSGGFDQRWIHEFGKEVIGNIYQTPERQKEK